MRAKVEPTSTPQVINPEVIPIGAPLVCEELEFEASPKVEFAPLLTGVELEFVPLLTLAGDKSRVGSLETVSHVPPDVAVGSYARNLTTPSLPSMTIESVLAVKMALRSLGGAVRDLVVLETTLTMYVHEKSSGMKANSVWTPSGWKRETALPCMAGKAGFLARL